MINTSQARTLLLIPAYNAGQYLPELLDRVRKIHPLKDTVIVNDGSIDDTQTVAVKYAVKVIIHSHNRGKGAALVSGFQYARMRNYGGVVTIDADLQHPPEYIPKLIAYALEGGFDMVIGSRRQKMNEIPLSRRISNYTSSAITSMITKTNIQDSQCGFRYISRLLLETISLTETGYLMETEIIIKAARAGMKIGFMPIPVIYNDSASSINKASDTLRFIRLTLRSLFT